MDTNNSLAWDPPGPGAWELEATHFGRPMSRFVQGPMLAGFGPGFAEGCARYGLLLDRLQPGFANSFAYHQPVPFGAPPGATKPPPAAVLWLLTRLHPKMRARIRRSTQAWADKQWRVDLASWDEVDKPAAIAKHRAFQAIEPAALSDAELADHVDLMARHCAESVFLHHKYTATSVVIAGDLLAGAVEWTGASAGEVLGLLRGTSQISRGFAADELDAAGKAIAASDSARVVLDGSPREPQATLDALAADPQAGASVRGYLEAVRFRNVDYDVASASAGELPHMMVGALRAAVRGTSADTAISTALSDLQARVPAEHQQEFAERLEEARLLNRLRDERGVYSDGWASGLARRAVLEAGRRLVEKGRLRAADHAVDLTAEEIRALLLETATAPSAKEVVERVEWRTTHTIEDAPPFLRAMPPTPPPVSLLPKRARRAALAVNLLLEHLFGVPDTPNTEEVLHGLPVNSGVYEGVARLVEDSADFGRIQPGDVLVTRMTSPYFNVVLPLLGGLVTDRGGQLCHAAIVAREYGIPGIVGTREATAKIRDGQRVRLDGATGEVHILR